MALGNRALMDRARRRRAELAQRAETLRAGGQTVVFLAVDGRLAGVVAVADPIKDGTPEAIREALHAEGVRVVMLTGDSDHGRAVARTLRIDEVIAEVLPNEKADVVKRLQAEGRIVAMAGDGINDAPALAQAQVGIAMGTGTDVAMESAGVTLVQGDLRASCALGGFRRATMAKHQAKISFSRSSTTAWACRSRRACCTRPSVCSRVR